MESSPIYLSVEAESLIQLVHHILFGVSTFFNAIATFCLWKQAPDMQSEIKIYLYGMQLLAFLADVILEIAIEPFGVLPVLGGYSKGLLGAWFGISDAVVLITFVLFLVGSCVQLCLLSRHQAMIKGRFKLGKVANHAARFALFAIVMSPAVYGLTITFDASETEALIDFHNISWVRSRGSPMLYKRTTEIGVTLPIMLIAVVTFMTILGTAMISHTIWFIQKGTTRSSTSMKRNSRALYMLSVQMGLPSALISIPGCLFFACFMDGTPLSFETCTSSLFLLSTHSSFHSILLLAITPAYRRFIVHFLYRIMCREIPQKRTVSVSVGKEFSARKL